MRHYLTDINKEQRLQTASHFARHRAASGHQQRFLHQTITEDEKCRVHVSTKQRKKWVAPSDTKCEEEHLKIDKKLNYSKISETFRRTEKYYLINRNSFKTRSKSHK